MREALRGRLNARDVSCAGRLQRIERQEDHAMLLRTLSMALAAATLGIGAPEPALGTNADYAWRQYIGATETRIGRELTSPRGFLAQDFTASSATDRRAVLGGGVVVTDVVTA